MSDQDDTLASRETAQEARASQSAEPPMEELDDEALENVAGGAVCQDGQTSCQTFFTNDAVA